MKASEKNSREPDTTTLALLRAWSAATSSMFCPAPPQQCRLEMNASLLNMFTKNIRDEKVNKYFLNYYLCQYNPFTKYTLYFSCRFTKRQERISFFHVYLAFNIICFLLIESKEQCFKKANNIHTQKKIKNEK